MSARSGGWLLPLAFVLGCGSEPQRASAPELSIDATLMLDTVRFLASAELQGRAAGSPGALAAARHVAETMLRLGLSTLPGERQHLQDLATLLASVEATSRVRVHAGGQVHELRSGEDFVAAPGTTARSARGRGAAVFCGYGIDAPHWNDYAGLGSEGLAGKVAVIALGSPRAGQHDDPFPDLAQKLAPGYRPFVDPADKAAAAARRGAVGVLFVQTPEHLRREVERTRELMGLATFLTTTLTCAALSENKSHPHHLPALQLYRSAAARLLAGGASLEERLAAIDAERRPSCAPLAGVEVELDVVVQHTPAPSANVLGRLEGSSPILGQASVWLTCHLDGTGSPATPPDAHHPGADCGASGVAVLLAVAKALAEHERRPHRAVVFAAFTGSLRGHVGAEVAAGSPHLAPERVRALLHLDRLGRGGEAPLLFEETHGSRELEGLLRTSFSAESLTLQPLSGLLRASDAWSFARRGVPAALLCGPRHADLHTAADVPEKLEPGSLLRVGRAVAHAVWALADS